MASEFTEIEKTRTVEYGNVITMLAQETKSKLESCVTVKKGIKGKLAVAADQIGEFQFVNGTHRLEDTPMFDINRARRWYEYIVKKGGVPLDNIDELLTTLDAKAPIVAAGMAGVNRAKDAEIIRGYYATNKTGEQAESSVSFDTDNVIASSYGSGDILKQLNRGIELFKENKVDFSAEEVYCVINSKAATKLRQAGIYISADHMDNKPLTSKVLTPYAGINFIEFEAVPSRTVDTTTTYQLPLFCKSGVGLGKWEDTKVRIGELQTKSYAWHIYMEFVLGASRLEEAKCLSLEIV